MSLSSYIIYSIVMPFTCSLTGGLPAQASKDPAVPVFQFISAALISGPGLAPPPGTKPLPAELVGVLRVRGYAVRHSSVRITLIPPIELKRSSKLARLVPTTWAPYDPNDKSLIRWTCEWPGPSSPNGWSVKVESLRSHPYRATSGPIQHFLLPVAQPQPKSNPSD